MTDCSAEFVDFSVLRDGHTTFVKVGFQSRFRPGFNCGIEKFVFLLVCVVSCLRSVFGACGSCRVGGFSEETACGIVGYRGSGGGGSGGNEVSVFALEFGFAHVFPYEGDHLMISFDRNGGIPRCVWSLGGRGYRDNHTMTLNLSQTMSRKASFQVRRRYLLRLS